MMRAVLLVGLVGCWVQPVQPPPAAPPPQNAPPPGTQVLRSEWRGTYSCAQGETAVHLSIEQRCAAAGCEVSAIFEFGPVATNPSVPHGSYRMLGEVSGNERGEAVLKLHPDAWIEQPPGYIMVGLTATSDADQRLMNGRIDNPSCGELAVQRVQ